MNPAPTSQYMFFAFSDFPVPAVAASLSCDSFLSPRVVCRVLLPHTGNASMPFRAGGPTSRDPFLFATLVAPYESTHLCRMHKRIPDASLLRRDGLRHKLHYV